MKRPIIFSVLIIITAFFSACGTKNSSGINEGKNLTVINSPVNGEVRRVLVSENIAVDANAPIIEIAVRSVSTNQSQPRPPVQKPRNIITEAQKEVERTSVEVSRVEQQVASNLAPQSQLDAARADYQRAQERLQQLQKNAASAPTNIQPIGNQPVSADPDEKIISVRAPSAGVVRVISVKRGQTITSGQPLATVSSDN